MPSDGGNGGLRFSREISLGQIVQLICVVATAVGFYYALAGRLDVFQERLEQQSARLHRVEIQVERIWERNWRNVDPQR